MLLKVFHRGPVLNYRYRYQVNTGLCPKVPVDFPSRVPQSARKGCPKVPVDNFLFSQGIVHNFLKITILRARILRGRYAL
jgi:hypothetical protein